MANSDYTTTVINLDTFTSVIAMPKLRVHSIEWVAPTTFGDTCVITDGKYGTKMINWTCHDVNQPYIKYFSNITLEPYIAASGVSSGELIIITY